MKGAKTSCMASSIFPPSTTIGVRRREAVGPDYDQVAVEDSPATAAAASSESTPSSGVMRKSARTSLAFGA